MESSQVEVSKVMSKNKELPESSYGAKQIHYENLVIRVRNLSGKILTIIDASFSDKEVKKAVKDLIKAEVREFIFHYQDYCSDGKAGQSIPDSDLTINQ